MSNNDRTYKIGIVGAGDMAQEHIRAFSDIAGVDVVGIHSRTRAKAQALAHTWQVGEVFDSVEEMFHQTNPDLLVVAVSEDAIFQVCKSSFVFPWTILLEKPVGLHATEAAQILSMAQNHKRDVRVALNRRYLSSTKTVLQDLQSNAGLRYIRLQDQQHFSVAQQLGCADIVVKNWMYVNSIHVIDYLRVFGRGNITSIQPIVAWQTDVPHLVVCKVVFDSGDIGLYEAIWNGPGPWAVTINTPQKRWEMRPLEQARYQLAGERVLHDADIHPVDTHFKPGFRLQAEDAIKVVKGEASHLPTLEDACKTMDLVKSIYCLDD